MSRAENKIKSFIASGAAAIFIAVDWLALHYIIKGNEPNLTGEYFVLVVSLVILTFIIYYFFKYILKVIK